MPYPDSDLKPEASLYPGTDENPPPIHDAVLPGSLHGGGKGQ